MNLQRLRRPAHWVPALVLLVGVVLTALTAHVMSGAEGDRQQLRQAGLVDGAGGLLRRHLSRCEEALRVGALMIGVAPATEIRDWHELARRLQVGKDKACAELIFYIEASAPAGPARPRSLVAPTSIDHWGLRRLDLGADPVHRKAMESARDSGLAQLTARTNWPGVAPDTPVLVWYMAVYRRDAATETTAERRLALLGHVGVPIRLPAVVAALEQQLPQARLRLEVREDEGGGRRDGDPGDRAGSVDRSLAIGGALWTLHASPVTTAPGPPGELRPSSISLASGLFLSALLAGLSWLLLTQSARALALARRYSREAREREARLRVVFDATRDVIFTLDVRGTILSVNETAQNILGFNAQELTGRTVASLMPVGQRQALADLWKRFLRSARQRQDGHGPVHELTLIHRDGHALSARGSLSLARIDNEEFVVWIVGDLTREREMERRAGEAATLNQAIMDVAPIGVLTFDTEGLVSSANVASHRMFGYAPGGLIGQHKSVLDSPDEGEPSNFADFDSGAVAPLATEQEREQRRQDGSRFPVAVYSQALRDASGHALGSLRMVMDITERKRAAAHIEHMALHDGLTGLPNRLLLQDRADQALVRAKRRSGEFAVMLIDLDLFKPINDKLGHAVGDQVLKRVADRLRATVRASDTVARIGGDEFALLLPEFTEPASVMALARAMLTALAEPMVVEGHRLRITSSIGVATYPAHGADLPTLLRHADAAMYDAKQRGRNAVSMFEARMAPAAPAPQQARAVRLDADDFTVPG